MCQWPNCSDLQFIPQSGDLGSLLAGNNINAKSKYMKKSIFTITLAMALGSMAMAEVTDKYCGDLNHDNAITVTDLEMLVSMKLKQMPKELINSTGTIYFEKDIEDKGDGSNGHSYVDLGTVIDGKKILWSVCNLGASMPEESGRFYAWGEDDDWTDTKGGRYNTDTYRWYDNVGKFYTKYVINDTDHRDDLTKLLPEDDAATQKWEGEWRMPELAEMAWLFDEANCTCTWKQVNSKDGFEFTSISTGKSIFLPACGWMGSSIQVPAQGHYWTSERGNGLDHLAEQVVMSYDSKNHKNDLFSKGNNRYYGRNIRPVFTMPEQRIVVPDQEKPIYNGDMNHDGMIDEDDIMILSKLILDLLPLEKIKSDTDFQFVPASL